jgi:hypothetical protein
MAIAAMTTNASAQPDIEFSLRTTPPNYSTELRYFRFPFVRFFSRFNGGVQAILLPRHNFLAAFDQVFGAFSQFTCFALCVFSAFIGLSGKVFACVFAGLRREEQSYQ